MNTTARLVEEALAAVPVLDIHTHLVGGQLGARGLHDVLLCHMVVSDLYAAGCPSGARLTQLELRADRLVFQFSFGAEPLPFETGSRLKQETIRQLGEIIGRHPRLKFQCLLSSRHANQSLCTLAREAILFRSPQQLLGMAPRQ
jgi:hypothetical protein